MRVLTLFLLSLIISCSFSESGTDDTPIARVKNKLLRQSDVLEIIPAYTSKEDSTLMMNNYIQNWIKDNLVLYKAELNLKDSQKDFEKQLEDYKRSLIVYSYEKQLIKERLDTIIKDQEIKEFYDENTPNFELKEDIVKVRYLKVNKKAPQVKKIRKFYKSDKVDEVEKLKELAHQYAEEFHLNENQWISFDKLKNEVPIETFQSKGYLKNIKNIEVEDSLSFYFVYINAYKLENDLSPLSFETENIKNIIINKRKLSLINKIRSDLFEEGIISKDIEIYENNSKRN